MTYIIEHLGRTERGDYYELLVHHPDGTIELRRELRRARIWRDPFVADPPVTNPC
jgi:hypothetical protein